MFKHKTIKKSKIFLSHRVLNQMFSKQNLSNKILTKNRPICHFSQISQMLYSIPKLMLIKNHLHFKDKNLQQAKLRFPLKIQLPLNKKKEDYLFRQEPRTKREGCLTKNKLENRLRRQKFLRQDKLWNPIQSKNRLHKIKQKSLKKL